MVLSSTGRSRINGNKVAARRRLEHGAKRSSHGAGTGLGVGARVRGGNCHGGAPRGVSPGGREGDALHSRGAPSECGIDQRANLREVRDPHADGGVRGITDCWLLARGNRVTWACGVGLDCDAIAVIPQGSQSVEHAPLNDGVLRGYGIGAFTRGFDHERERGAIPGDTGLALADARNAGRLGRG